MTVVPSWLKPVVFTVTIPKGAEEVKGLSGFSIFGAATDDANGEM